MKKGFTLVEMLIVVVVLVTLMSITFRLTSVGDDQKRRNSTIARLQRLENCLSGYYAAYGTYPPVPQHGERNYNIEANDYGIQTGKAKELRLDWYSESASGHGIGTQNEEDDWRQVRAACLVQPIAMRAPVPENCNELIKALAEQAKENLSNGEDTNKDERHRRIVSAGWDDGYTSNPGRHEKASSDWRDCHLFQFGVLSYLLPRYMVMLNGDESFFTSCAQWTSNNNLPADPLGMGEKFTSWSEIRQALERGQQGNKTELARVANIPSQAVCARWLPNLEKSCYKLGFCESKFYGIEVEDGSQWSAEPDGSIFSPGNQSGGGSNPYMLGGLTIMDGWGHELYYDSPSPHQSYTLWSAGKNGRTFPPWVNRVSLSQKENLCVNAWIEDDIVHLSN